MSLITRCPACQTLFKVVPDQLRISEGWVRCGQCDEVFDASANLFQEAQPLPVFEAPVQTAQLPPEHLQSATPQIEETPEPPPPTGTAHLTIEEKSFDAEPVWPEVDTSLPVGAHRENPEPFLERVEAHDFSTPSFAESNTDLKSDIALAAASPTEDPVFPAVSFMKEAAVESAWRRPMVRLALGLTGFLLLILLGVQVAVQERDRIVALHPEVRPILLALCSPLNCGLAPLRQIESIVIDNASFTKIRGDAYRLGLSIRNSAPVVVAMPSLELTLTDSQEQTVLKKVFSPAEFGAPATSLAARSDWSGGFAVNATDLAGSERIAGYRVLAFYP